MMQAQPIRLSKALPKHNPCSSSYSNATSGAAGSPILIPKLSIASFLLHAPTSKNISRMSSGALFSLSVIKCTGREVVMPFTSFPALVRTSKVCAGILGKSIPPNMIRLNRPFSMIPCTINPHSSVWASSISTGFFPFAFPPILAYTLFMASLVRLMPVQWSLTALTTSSSNPLGPKALVRSFNTLISIMFICSSYKKSSSFHHLTAACNDGI